MIPTNKVLSTKLTPQIIEKVLLMPNNYFKIADEYTSLQKIFVKETLLEKAMLWMDMVISPILTIIKSIFSFEVPQPFTLMSLHKSFSLWKDWFRMHELRKLIREWILIVRSIGGPYISTNDAEYHTFVYADAMVRIQNSLLLLITEKSAKRT